MTKAFTMLIEDHDKFKDELEKIMATTDKAIKTREELFTRLKKEIELHSKIEEQILYPLLEEKKDTKDLTLESYEEHHVVDELLAEINTLDPSDETWIAKVTVLKENLEHHIKEEEDELFPKAQKILDKKTIEELEKEMQDMKKSN